MHHGHTAVPAKDHQVACLDEKLLFPVDDADHLHGLVNYHVIRHIYKEAILGKSQVEGMEPVFVLICIFAVMGFEDPGVLLHGCCQAARDHAIVVLFEGFFGIDVPSVEQ